MARWLPLLLLLPLSVSAETVRFQTADGKTIVGEFHAARGDAPTVICLPMYRRDKTTYAPLLPALRAKGFHVLVLDLRGHGESAPELAAAVAERDPKLFLAMHRDVEAAFAFLQEEKRCDPTRMGVVGASVGCSVAVDTTVRNPHLVRAVVLLTPGSKYLGVPTLEHLRRWPGTRIFTFTSSEEQKTSAAVMDALAPFDGSNHMVIPGSGIHGTLMFGKVTAIEELIANFLETSLSDPVDLRVPRESPLVLSRKVGEATYSVSIRIEGSRWEFGAEVDRPFRGRLELWLDQETLVFPLETGGEAGGEVRAEKGDAAARQTPTGLVVEREGLEEGVRLFVEFRPEKGPSVRFPGGKSSFAARPGTPSG